MERLADIFDDENVFTSSLLLGLCGALLVLGSCIAPGLVRFGRSANGSDCRPDEPFEGNNQRTCSMQGGSVVHSYINSNSLHSSVLIFSVCNHIYVGVFVPGVLIASLLWFETFGSGSYDVFMIVFNCNSAIVSTGDKNTRSAELTAYSTSLVCVLTPLPPTPKTHPSNDQLETYRKKKGQKKS